MRARHLTAALALAALAVPGVGAAMVVVRHPVYVAPHPVVVVAPAPVYVAPAPVYVAPPPQAAPPPPPPLTTALPVNSTMWVLPSGCLKIAMGGQPYYQCGPNYLKPIQSDKGTYYAVVPPPQ
jgi:hypothetical protein